MYTLVSTHAQTHTHTHIHTHAHTHTHTHVSSHHCPMSQLIHLFISLLCPQALRDYRLVEPLTITPPWCLTVKASGHTIDPNSEAFLPKVAFDSRNLVFPATLPGEASFRTVIMKNNGDTPTMFDFAGDPTG